MKKNTILTSVGRPTKSVHGVVNQPVYRGSTILFPTMEEYEARDSNPFEGMSYGIHGTPTTFALEDAFTALEGGYRSSVVQSGLAAITTSLLAFASSGDHILVTDSVYGPTRRFCNKTLTRLGIETTYYDPMISSGIKDLIRDNTSLILCESPGSHTFEVQDIRAISDAAHSKNPDITVIVDNTWAAGYYFRPLEHGADVSFQAGTKYIAGHSDILIGMITATEKSFMPIKKLCIEIGNYASPDDCFLALRGLRTLATRLPAHYKSGLEVAKWLEQRSEVNKIIHPALPGCPGHDIWKRDFTGASSLFGIELKDVPKKAVAAMLDGMELFGMGSSWGGFESLIIPGVKPHMRTASKWEHKGPLLRLHIGLEDTEDLIEDLRNGFDRLNAALT